MTDSRDKGARGEREIANILTAAGFTSHRGQQFSGGADSPDVVCPQLKDTYHFEVKHVERLNLYDAIEQSNNDKSENQIGLVIHKKNRKPWLVSMLFDQWLNKIKKEYAPIVKLTFPAAENSLGYTMVEINKYFSDSFKKLLVDDLSDCYYIDGSGDILIPANVILTVAIKLIFK